MSFQYPAKRRFTKVALALLLYEFLFQVGSGFLIQYGSAVYQQEDFTMIAVSLFGRRMRVSGRLRISGC